MLLLAKPCPVCKKPALPCVNSDRLVVCLACNEAYKVDENGNLEPGIWETLRQAAIGANVGK